MKILLVNKFHYLKGGSERYYFTLADAFKAQGHEVIFFSMKDERNVPCGQDKYFVNHSGIGGGLKDKISLLLHVSYSKEAYKKMTELLVIEKPDLVILNLVHRQITCSIIDAIKDFNHKIPIFWTMHDLICACPAYTMLDGKNNICEKCLDGNFNHCIYNKCTHNSYLMSWLSAHEAKQIRKHKWYDKVDLYICPSEFYKKKLEQAYFTKSKIVCMRNPLPIDTKYECNNHDEGYILYFGRLSKEKGVKTLIDAMKTIDYKLIILGTGPLEKELKNYVISSKINNVEFKGFQEGEKLKTYIRNSRCVVLPSEWYENGPYSAMESMALGKPLIVSNKGGLPELVEDGANGYIYNNKEELKEKINTICTINKEAYDLICLNSYNKSIGIFNPINYCEGILAKVEIFTF